MNFTLPRSLFIWLFFSTLLFFKSCNADDPSFFRLCSQSANYTDGSLFHSNLHQLFLTLVDNGPINGFYNTSTGQNPEKVYGLIQCRGDVVGSEECGLCLNRLITEVMELCPNKKEAVLLLDNCLMRYSTVNFFGAINTSILAEGTDIRSVSDPFNPDVNAQVLMDRLVGRIPSSALRFAADNLSVGDSDERRYGMVQCTRDLSNSDCGICLDYLLHNTTKVVEGSRGWRILAVSCLIRYEDYAFAFGEGSNGGTTGGRRLPKTVVVIISLVAALATLLLGSAYCLWRKKEIKKVKKENFGEVRLPDLESPTRTAFSYADLFGGSHGKIQDLPLIDLATVQAATDNFSNYNKLGKGGFGPVYKGKLVDGREVAVKRLSKNSGQGLEEFKNEVVLIAKLQHKNLVRLLFCCLEREEKLLIYEYMPNKSLDVFLFDPNKRGELDWRRRFNIIVGIARGLLYLHEDSRLKVIHRDLKASNILLDNDMNPKISDFGIARIFDGEQNNANTNRIVGTYGYMAPEYAMGGLFSVKSDVFSFGVLILEIITGRKNSGFYLSEDAHSLLLYAWRLWSEGKGLELMDPLVGESFTTSEVVRCVHIGLLCVQGDAADRPTMSLVVHMLASDFVSLPQPLQPAFSVRRSITSSNQSSNSANESCTNNVTISQFEPR